MQKLRASAEMKGQMFRFLITLVFMEGKGKSAQACRDTLEECPSLLDMVLTAASVGMDATLQKVLEGLEKSEA